MKTLTMATVSKWVVIRLPILLSALFLFWGTKQPLFEIKGFGSFDLSTVSAWATMASRWVLTMTLLTLLLPKISASRLMLTLAVGLLASPLAGMVSDARELSGLGGDFTREDFDRLIVLHRGAVYMGAGLTLWIVDFLIQSGLEVCSWWRQRND